MSGPQDEARAAMLAAIDAATHEVADADPDRTHAALPRGYRLCSEDGALAARLERFEERLLDYGVDVVRCDPDTVARRLAQELAQRQAQQVVLAAGLPEAWTAHLAGLTQVADTAAPAALDAAHAVVTGCEVAIAETGTVVLTGGPGQGPRAATLVPDLHLCLVPSSRLVSEVPEGVAWLQSAAESGAAMVWISGPSATSDIELVRVAGVHGPRRMVVLLLNDGPPLNDAGS